MKQAIAGVTPTDSKEVTVMVVWPSVSRYWLGQQLGQAYSIDAGFYVLTVGNLIALASIPVAIALYFFRLAPSFMGTPVHGCFFELTNRRVAELRNEINMGEGPRWMRVWPARIMIGLGLLAFLGQRVVWNEGLIPQSLGEVIFAVFCLFLVVGGIFPLVREANGKPVPIPRFSFGVVTKSVELDRFDEIEIVRQPGQEWFDAGDMVFKRDGVETFRLNGVSRPDAFLHTCMKSHMSYVGVKQALEQEALQHA